MEHLLTFLTLSLATFASSTPLGWHRNYRDAVEDVRRQDKPLFVVFGAGFLVHDGIQQIGFVATGEIDRSVKAEYVWLYVDTDTAAGEILAKRFGISASPYVVVIDRSGSWQMYRREGTHTLGQIRLLLQKFRGVRYESDGTTVGFNPREQSVVFCPI